MEERSAIVNFKNYNFKRELATLEIRDIKYFPKRKKCTIAKPPPMFIIVPAELRWSTPNSRSLIFDYCSNVRSVLLNMCRAIFGICMRWNRIQGTGLHPLHGSLLSNCRSEGYFMHWMAFDCLCLPSASSDYNYWSDSSHSNLSVATKSNVLLPLVVRLSFRQCRNHVTHAYANRDMPRIGMWRWRYHNWLPCK